jgi:hypothetical protein
MEYFGVAVFGGGRKLLKRWSGRRGSNPRRPAWEYVTSTYLQHLGVSDALSRLSQVTPNQSFLLSTLLIKVGSRYIVIHSYLVFVWHPLAINNDGPRATASHRPIGVKIEYFQQQYTPPPSAKKRRNYTYQCLFCRRRTAARTAAATTRKLIGSDLTPGDYAALEARWIDRELADRARLRRVDSLSGGDIVGRKGSEYSGLIIPYFRPGTDHVRDYRLRRDHPDMEYDSSGNLKPRQKYLSPPGRSNMLYPPPDVSQEFLHDASLPVLITEGEFKTLALWRLANHRAPDRPRFLPIGVSGVYNWRGTIGKTIGPDGKRLDVNGAIPDLDWIAWEGRRVVIAYDADAVTKELVRIARSELGSHLRGRGSIVGFLEWEANRGKGIDDHLSCVGPEMVLDEISHVDFTGSGWKKDLLRSKPPMNNTKAAFYLYWQMPSPPSGTRRSGEACLRSTNSHSAQWL